MMEPASEGRGILTVRWRGRFSTVAAAILGTAAWGAVLYLVLRKYGAGATGPPFALPAAVIVSVSGIAGGLFFTVCRIYGGRAVFDPAIHTVIIGGLTGKRLVMSFESVARIAPIEEVTPLSTRVVFCLVPKLSPLFGVSAISGPLKQGSEEYADFERRVLEIARMLGIKGTRTCREAANTLPTARYRKEGSCYVKNFAGGFIRDLADAAILIVLTSFLSFRAPALDIHPIAFGVAAVVAVHVIYKFALFFFRRIRSVRIDPNAGELRQKGGVRVGRRSRLSFFGGQMFRGVLERSSGHQLFEKEDILGSGRRARNRGDYSGWTAGKGHRRRDEVSGRDVRS